MLGLTINNALNFFLVFLRNLIFKLLVKLEISFGKTPYSLPYGFCACS